MSAVRVAVAQMTSTSDVKRNLATAGELVAQAAAKGATFVGLPENFAFIGNETDKLALAEDLGKSDGPIVAALRTMARKHHVWLLGGGMPERSAEAGRVHNSAVLLDADGEIRTTYRKIHLFDVRITAGAVFTESATVVPGEQPTTADLPWGRVGLSVCYDLRFPELYRQLVQKGARALMVPSAFTQYTGSFHWHVLLRARAVENLCFVLAPAQFGRHNERRTTYGHALIVDPWGAILAEAPDRECVVVADLDLARQNQMRRELPCLDHRRL